MEAPQNSLLSSFLIQVHSSFCSERGEVKGRKMTIGAEVAEDWNFLAIYNGLVVGMAEKANELVLQTKTGDPHQLWKFKDGLLMNKNGLVAECKPRGFPKWWQVRPTKDISENFIGQSRGTEY